MVYSWVYKIMKNQIVAALFLGLVVACTGPHGLTTSQQSRSADDFFIVDCLLPGEVRNLGQIATYVTARKAVKLTAQECGVRGGEYAAHGQSNYATALKVWMPRAESGEATAQAYVGEIFEKGMGIAPDYNLAVYWYRKAAEQGNSRAQINLGFLYEKGLGVEQDRAKAMALYKKSSGLESSGIAYASTINTQEKDSLNQEMVFLRTELKNNKNESRELSAQLEKTQQQLIKEQNILKQTENLLQHTKDRLNVATIDDDKAEIILLQGLLKQKQNRVSEQVSKVADLDEQYGMKVSDLMQKMEEMQKRSKQIAKELQAHQSEKNNMELKLLNAQARLVDTEKQLLEIEVRHRHELEGMVSAANVQEQARLIAQLKKEKKQFGKKIQLLEKNVEQQSGTNKPSIEIIDPPFILVRGTPTVKLRSAVKARDVIGKVNAPSGIMSLMINDQRRTVDKQGLFQEKIKLTELDTPVEVVVVDKKGARATIDFVLSLPQKSQLTIGETEKKLSSQVDKSWNTIDFGKYYALVIGNNSYQKIPKLDTPVDDAKKVANVLKNKYGFETKLLLNANRYQILSALNKLRASLTEKDNLLVYYAGHGELDRVNMRGHWLPVDADADNTANWVSTVAITDILNSMSVKHIMVVSDSCYSGAMTRSSLARLEAGLSGEKKSQWLKAMLKAKSRTVLTSGGLKPVMDGGGGKHSVFANAFINALENNATLLEGQALYRQVSSNIVAIAADYGIEQVPEYAPIRHAGHESGEFFFVPK